MSTLTPKLRSAMAIVATLLVVQPPPTFAASHREAPITALDQKADITDWFAFVSPEHPNKVIFIMNVDPFLEPSNGPNYFPFDPGILYEMKIDNNQDGVPDVTFQFRFQTQLTNPGIFTGFVGNLAGIPPITSLTGDGAQGLGFQQTYSITMVTKSGTFPISDDIVLHTVPTNVGPRTMPNYAQLVEQGIYTLDNGIRVFAGTVADPFFIDLGGFFDSLNLRASVAPILSAAVDGDDHNNYAPNSVSGYNVNSIVLEVPITMLTSDGQMHASTDAAAVIGTYATTSRQKITVLGESGRGGWSQVQRLGNPLINEAIIGTGAKDLFSMSDPINDDQFANFLLNPLAPQILSTLGLPVPPAPRTDLLPLVQYMAPICPGCTTAQAGPVADLLRLNTGVPVTSTASAKRLGLIAGDAAGWPNGRRLTDDVFDIALRALEGILVNAKTYGAPLGDGVNVSSSTIGATFPFVGPAYSGRNSVHEGPGQAGCAMQPNGICPVN
jgi:Domain of unknown function (DUF4331)